jgi:hypothetical protein
MKKEEKIYMMKKTYIYKKYKENIIIIKAEREGATRWVLLF